MEIVNNPNHNLYGKYKFGDQCKQIEYQTTNQQQYDQNKLSSYQYEIKKRQNPKKYMETLEISHNPLSKQEHYTTSQRYAQQPYQYQTNGNLSSQQNKESDHNIYKSLSQVAFDNKQNYPKNDVQLKSYIRPKEIDVYQIPYKKVIKANQPQHMEKQYQSFKKYKNESNVILGSEIDKGRFDTQQKLDFTGIKGQQQKRDPLIDKIAYGDFNQSKNNYQSQSLKNKSILSSVGLSSYDYYNRQKQILQQNEVLYNKNSQDQNSHLQDYLIKKEQENQSQNNQDQVLQNNNYIQSQRQKQVYRNQSQLQQLWNEGTNDQKQNNQQDLKKNQQQNLNNFHIENQEQADIYNNRQANLNTEKQQEQQQKEEEQILNYK
ncbi:hypothetical protein PPERSA_07968 [Pseudocohnilembus persalinus]|uniref:Uncharacterized protein n=1 Tax=Pseudocohnilembus persalinus TaxID=266149 RepID=A0A0V0QBF5_PSEPJ|nr:hypothetical protein PPERSA_07968 [Pseudocohnilembus persalinus]|eukprot:KRW99483.1 hypothetical protein PPERSA_07968 [Pseudocohnilembus persalinus]